MMEASRWCVDCDRIEAEVGSEVCFRCKRRRLAGEPVLVELEREQQAKASRRYVVLKGYYNAEIP